LGIIALFLINIATQGRQSGQGNNVVLLLCYFKGS